MLVQAHDEVVTADRIPPQALTHLSFALARLLGGVTLRVAPWPPHRVVVDHHHQIIWVSDTLPPRYHNAAVSMGLDLLRRGRSIATGPDGEPLWSLQAAGGDRVDLRPPEDPPSNPRLRLVRGIE